jgi:hypothetical protein
MFGPRRVAESSADDGFFALLDALAARLTAAGFPEHGRSLHALLHEIPWTTSSELLGELGLLLRQVKRETRRRLPADDAKALARAIKALRRGRPRMS